MNLDDLEITIPPDTYEVRIKHKPTGIVILADSKELAITRLERILAKPYEQGAVNNVA